MLKQGFYIPQSMIDSSVQETSSLAKSRLVPSLALDKESNSGGMVPDVISSFLSKYNARKQGVSVHRESSFRDHQPGSESRFN